MTERYELINREEGSYPISSMCRWSRVSKSGYYSWRDRPQSQAAVRREGLAILIKDVFEHSDGTYGYRRIQVVLERRGVRADGSKIRAIMRGLGLQAAGPRAKVRTTVPAQDLEIVGGGGGLPMAAVKMSRGGGDANVMVRELPPSAKYFRRQGIIRYSYSSLGCKDDSWVDATEAFCRDLEGLIRCREC